MPLRDPLESPERETAPGSAAAPRVVPAERWRGAGMGTRTPNLLITNQLLCQLSYAGMPVVDQGSSVADAVCAGGSCQPNVAALSETGLDHGR